MKRYLWSSRRLGSGNVSVTADFIDEIRDPFPSNPVNRLGCLHGPVEKVSATRPLVPSSKDHTSWNKRITWIEEWVYVQRKVVLWASRRAVQHDVGTGDDGSSLSTCCTQQKLILEHSYVVKDIGTFQKSYPSSYFQGHKNYLRHMKPTLGCEYYHSSTGNF